VQVAQAYRFALDPTPSQERALRAHAGAARVADAIGLVVAVLALAERTYACAACGLVLDRDVNAARNLAALGRRELSGSGPDSNGRGADRQTSPWGAGGCEASTRHAETRSGRDRPDARRDCGLSAFSAQLLRQLIPGTPEPLQRRVFPRTHEGPVKEWSNWWQTTNLQPQFSGGRYTTVASDPAGRVLACNVRQGAEGASLSPEPLRHQGPTGQANLEPMW
jgi:hypothetical protein